VQKFFDPNIRILCRDQRNRLRGAQQPLISCIDPRLRCCWQRDRDTRPQGRFQRGV